MNLKGYHIKKVAEVIKGGFLSFSSDDLIYELATDSRQMLSDSSLFFAIVSERNDGHKYLKDAYQKGVRNFIVSKEVSTENLPNSNIVKVENCLTSLQKLAVHHRQQFSIPIVGITGSNGKSTVKEWLYQLLHDDFRIVRSPKSFNSQVGVPLSVWNMEAKDELGIFEAGISMVGEMENLQQIIAPSIGIITNIGDAHSENFSSKTEVAAEKLKLFASCEKLIYCKDDEHIQSQLPALPATNLLSWSFKKEATLQITATDQIAKNTRIEGIIQGKKIAFSIPFLDKASVENSISCWLLMYSLGFSPESTAFKMLQLQQVAMRLELKAGINGSTLINDSYNSDFQSLKIALQLLSQQNQHSKKSVILSDLVQVFSSKKNLYKKVAELLDENHIDGFTGIGEDISKHAGFFPTDSTFYKNTKDFIQAMDLKFYAGAAILIKGARKFEFEKITEVLQQKSHETVLEINLSAMVDNLNYFKSKIKKDSKIMAMVKAFSYGAGAHDIANVLQFHQIDYLSVAYADEGIALREAGITTPIMVMNPETESYESMIRNNLEPEIFSFRVLEKFQSALEENQYFISDDKSYPIHIKLDTGMHRLGFVESEIEDLIEKIKALKKLKIVSVFSHLTSSEDKTQDNFTQRQITVFEKMMNQLKKELGNQILFHLVNSNGILRFPEAHYGMVRLGIGLYGVISNKKYQKKLRPLFVLKSSISQIKEVKKGETIGYSRKGVMEKDGKIATLPIGYADGLSRKLGNGNWHIQIGNQLFPTIGNICMDMCMIDLGDFAANEGEEVIIYGSKKDIFQLSEALEKTPYETLTGIGSRVKRIYFYE